MSTNNNDTELDALMYNIASLQHEFGYFFKDTNYLYQAFTRKNYINEHPNERLKDFECLETVGDTMLKAYLAERLYDIFELFDAKNKTKLINIFGSEEGYITKVKSVLEKNDSLSRYMERLGWTKYLIKSKDENIDSTKVRSNLFEAIIGAVYIDSRDFSSIGRVINLMMMYDELIGSNMLKSSDIILTKDIIISALDLEEKQELDTDKVHYTLKDNRNKNQTIIDEIIDAAKIDTYVLNQLLTCYSHIFENVII